MAIPLYHAVASVAPDPAAIFTRAQTAWTQRQEPPYESFTLPCAQTLLADACAPGARVQFIVRFADGRTFAQTIAEDDRPAVVLLRGGFIVGPAGAPFGFYRRAPQPGATQPSATIAPPPPNLAADPIATIATVSAVDRAYDITLAGMQTLGSRVCYHLRLRPLRAPQTYPLRDLWIDAQTYDVVRLTYAWPFNDTTAQITYGFAPVGPHAIWSIVHIEAQAVSHGLFTTHEQSVSEELHDIEFPASVPESDFVSPAP
ncbi:MAG TPA: hypothetical protein VMV65_06540 [Alphaproteobacteria bacterium]|nr:hypothetical protein [Alphaproteobacteria bacterium]